jgi:hypothetical protein
VAPEFVAAGLIALPVLSVILAAFAGGLTDRAPLVVDSAVWTQAVTLGLGVLSWLGALDERPHLRPSVWFVSYAVDLAVLATALVFTAAVRRSRALRSPALQFEDFAEEDENLPAED